MTEVSVNKFNYPEYVDDILNYLSEETKQLMIKNVILSQVELNNEGNFKISKIAQSLTNRVEVLPDTESVNSMLSIMSELYPYWLTNKL